MILGFVRISTYRQVLARPLPVATACAHARAWLAQPYVAILDPGTRHAEILFGFLESMGTAGNLTTDAHLAALAVEHQAELHSTRRRFCAVPGAALDQSAGRPIISRMTAIRHRATLATQNVGQFQRGVDPPKVGAVMAERSSAGEKSDQAVLVAVRSSCSACRESVALYRAIADHLKNNRRWHFIILGNSWDSDIVDWLEKERIQAELVIVDDIGVKGFWATPTLLLLKSSLITDIAVGKLTAVEERQLWNRLADPIDTQPFDNTYSPREVTDSEISRFAPKTQIVDLRRPNAFRVQHHPDAINMAAKELVERARGGLLDGGIVLDCRFGYLAECRASAFALQKAGVVDIALLVPSR